MQTLGLLCVLAALGIAALLNGCVLLYVLARTIRILFRHTAISPQPHTRRLVFSHR